MLSHLLAPIGLGGVQQLALDIRFLMSVAQGYVTNNATTYSQNIIRKACKQFSRRGLCNGSLPSRSSSAHSSAPPHRTDDEKAVTDTLFPEDWFKSVVEKSLIGTITWQKFNSDEAPPKEETKI